MYDMRLYAWNQTKIWGEEVIDMKRERDKEREREKDRMTWKRKGEKGNEKKWEIECKNRSLFNYYHNFLK